MKTTAAIIEILKREGTEFLSCFPQNPIIEAAAEGDLKPIICRQERIGIAIADAYSRVHSGRRIGVFVMQSGPGAENAFGAVAQAYSESVPVLLLPGGQGRDRAGVRPLFSATRNYEKVVKWGVELNLPERTSALMRHAYSQLKTGRPGPVVIEVPRDVMGAEAGDVSGYKPFRGAISEAAPEDVREAVRILLGAKCPIIIAGQGVLYAEASEELQQLAELLGIPVATTLSAKSAFPESHPLSLGTAGRSTTGQLKHFYKKADVVFGIGSSFTRTPFGQDVPPGKVIIQSTNDVYDINKDYPVEVGLVGDAKLVLKQVIAEVKRVHKSATAGHDAAAEIKSVKTEWLKEWMPRLTSDETPINPYRVVYELGRTIDRARAIVTHDAGSPRDQMVPFYEATVPHSYIGWGKTTQLGYGLGLAMGAKLAAPDKLCVNIMGDAAIGMVGMDIETASRNKIGSLTIVLNNSAMSIEVPTLVVATEKYGAKWMYGNYCQVAEALGGWGERVSKPQEIAPAIRRAVEVTKTGRPALLEFITKEEREFSL